MEDLNELNQTSKSFGLWLRVVSLAIIPHLLIFILNKWKQYLLVYQSIKQDLWKNVYTLLSKIVTKGNNSKLQQ